ncbi:MAG: rhodanese-like domain-containing protein [Cryomorphaceae bacterium]|nr:rhodanese-like domain-containing protein [Cryomorphaceae bacterium]
MNIQEMIKNGATIIDVRTPAEFQGGHVDGSINIPMNEFVARMEEVKALPHPLVLCCASGNRSGQVTQYMNGNGHKDVYNGGGWLEVNALKTQN